MSSVEPPESPSGWSKPTPFPESRWVNGFWLIGLSLLSVAIYLPDIRRMFISDPLSVFGLVAYHPFQFVVTAFLALAGNVVVHEDIHKYISGKLGYESIIKWRQMVRGRNPFNYIPDNWVDAGDYVLILFAPLVIINAVAATLLVMNVVFLVNYWSAALLVINTITSGDDVRKFILITRESRKMKIHHLNNDGSLVVYRTYKIDD